MNRNPLLTNINCGVVSMPQLAVCPVNTVPPKAMPDLQKKASEVAARLAEGGVTFSYHNHSFELERFDGRTRFRNLVR